MALERVTKRSVPDDVFDQLVREVLGGDVAPGESLPSERRLAEVLGVSRPAVREALQRLAQSGLVDVRQGGSTLVRDYRRHGGLDLLAHLVVRNGTVDLAVVRSILEARALVGPRIAELAAERGGALLREPLDRALAALAALEAPTDSIDDRDGVVHQRRAVDFWQVLVDGADSITFRLMFNGMLAAYEPAMPLLAGVMAVEAGRHDLYRALRDAVVAGDGPTARERATEILALAGSALEALLDTLSPQQKDGA